MDSATARMWSKLVDEGGGNTTTATTAKSTVPSTSTDNETPSSSNVPPTGEKIKDDNYTEEDDDDDDDLDRFHRVQSTMSSDDEWWNWFCGGDGIKHVWLFLRKEILIALIAVITAVIGVIVQLSCEYLPHRCEVFGAPVSQYMDVVASSLVFSIPARIIDKIIFSVIQAATASVSSETINTIVFYITAFEGSIHRFIWIGLTWIVADRILELRDPWYLERGMLCLLIAQILAVAKNLAVRVILRNVLISSFSEKIQDILFGLSALLMVTKVPQLNLNEEGKLILEKDNAQKELHRMLVSTNFPAKLDFISKLRFRMYNKQGLLQPVGSGVLLTSYARYAYKALVRLPSTALVEFDVYDRAGEEIHVSNYVNGTTNNPTVASSSSSMNNNPNTTNNYTLPTGTGIPTIPLQRQSSSFGPSRNNNVSNENNSYRNSTTNSNSNNTNLLVSAVQNSSSTNSLNGGEEEDSVTNKSTPNPRVNVYSGGYETPADEGWDPTQATNSVLDKAEEISDKDSLYSHGNLQRGASLRPRDFGLQRTISIMGRPRAGTLRDVAERFVGGVSSSLRVGTHASPSLIPNSIVSSPSSRDRTTSTASHILTKTTPSFHGSNQFSDSTFGSSPSNMNQPPHEPPPVTPYLLPVGSPPLSSTSSLPALTSSSSSTTTTTRSRLLTPSTFQPPEGLFRSSTGDSTAPMKSIREVASIPSVSETRTVGQSTMPSTRFNGATGSLASPSRRNNNPSTVVTDTNTTETIPVSLSSSLPTSFSQNTLTRSSDPMLDRSTIFNSINMNRRPSDPGSLRTTGSTLGATTEIVGKTGNLRGSTLSNLNALGNLSHFVSIGANMKHVREAFRIGLMDALRNDDYLNSTGNFNPSNPSTTVIEPNKSGKITDSNGKTVTDPSVKHKPRKMDYPPLLPGHFAACIEHNELDVNKVFSLFDSNGDGNVKMDEFIAGCESVLSNLKSLKTSLNGHQSVVTALTTVMDAAFGIVLLVAVSFAIEIPVVQVFVPLGTVLVSLSFAIGQSISNIVSSLIFVIISRPYDVGDRVTASCVFSGDETLIVKRIDVLSTTFLRIVNKEITVPNWVLLSANIENFKRSPPAVMKLELVVSVLTTAIQLETLRRYTNTYLESQTLAWKPACTIRASMVRDQSIVLTLWVQSHYTYQEAPKLFKANFHLWMHLLTAMRDIGISFRAPDQAVRIEGSLQTMISNGSNSSSSSNSTNSKSSSNSPILSSTLSNNVNASFPWMNGSNGSYPPMMMVPFMGPPALNSTSPVNPGSTSSPLVMMMVPSHLVSTVSSVLNTTELQNKDSTTK